MLYTQFWQKQKRCLKCAGPIKSIISQGGNYAGDIPPSIGAQNVCETCMSLTYIHLKSALAQSTFIASLPTNDSYKKYYREHSNARKQALDAILQNCNHGCWQRMLVLIDFCKGFSWCSQAMLSSRCSIDLLYFDCSGHQERCGSYHQGRGWKVSWILGPGSAEVITNVIDYQFNIDGAKPPGSKVGIIDEYHIWFS